MNQKLQHLFLVAFIGCGASSEPGGTSQFVRVTMAEAGFCDDGSNCGHVTRVSADAELSLDVPDGSHKAMLSSDELQRVKAIVNEPGFHGALSSKTPTCPPTFDFDLSFELETSDGLLRDTQAAGCTSDDHAKHPYRRLRKLLAGLTAAHFVDVPPF